MRRTAVLLAMLIVALGFGQEPDSDIQSLTPAIAQASTATNSELQPSTSAEERGALGTKQDLVQPKSTVPNTPVVGGMQIFQMVIALTIVFGLLKYGLPKVIGKFGKKLSTPFDSAIDLQEAASFGAGSLQVINVRGKTLLLGVTQTGITCLADLTSSNFNPASEPAFFDLVDKAQQIDTEVLRTKAVIENMPGESKQKPTNPKVKAYQTSTTKMSDDELSQDLKARLERLSKLVS